MKIIELIRSGQLPTPGGLLDALEVVFPLLGALENTPQDAEWHGEGNVRIHTEMVVAEAIQLINSGEVTFSKEQQVALLVGAALHDIGKALTTQEEEIHGKIRIVSPHHAERGRSYAAPLMGSLALEDGEIKSILGIIRYHHDVRKVVSQNSEKRAYTRLARCIDLPLLYWFERCDNLGRICHDMSENLETLELFRAEAESLNLFQNTDPYAEWKSFFDREITVQSERDYVTGYAIADFEKGLINSPEEALARHWQHRAHHGSVTVISAPGGAGKTTWIKENTDGETVVISLDDLREELTGKRSDQSMNGQVLQLGKERLRQALREKRDIIWDSTSLRRDNRSMVLDLGLDYHAKTRIVALGTPPEVAHQRNRDRKAQIPASILEKQYHQWQWPDLSEAHSVEEFFF
jgi:predicted kinase